jgi:hypothetical protein
MVSKVQQVGQQKSDGGQEEEEEIIILPTNTHAI